MNKKLELTWSGKNDKNLIEPRILIEDSEKSYGDKNHENLLIHGDNLLALKALEKDYCNRIKCIYIDPPYNADATDVPFDDNMEHSFYLNLMKLRIEELYKLLSIDGIFCMQCDYNEMAYLKVVCDEIFGRSNYVTMITVKTSSESGVKVNANKPAKVSEYILMYAKDKDKVKYNTIRIVTDYDKNYSTYILNPEDSYKDWKFKNIKDILSEQIEKKKKDLTNEELRKFQIENKDRIFSVRDISDSLKKFIKENNIDTNSVYEYVTSTGKRTLLYKNGEIVFKSPKSINGVKTVIEKAAGTIDPILQVTTKGKSKATLKDYELSEKYELEFNDNSDLEDESSQIINKMSTIDTLNFSNDSHQEIYERNKVKIIPFVKK